MLGNKEPRSKFVDFLLDQPTIGNLSEGCFGSDCLAYPNGFYSGNVPWIGYPSKIEVNNQTDSIEFHCLVSNEELDLTIVNKNHSQKLLETNSKSVSVVNDMKIVKFVLENPYEKLGKYYCKNSNGIESSDVLDISESQDTWTSWTPWSKCTNVQVEKVTRSRNSSSGQTEIQNRFCRCSDLKELPRPR